MFFVYYLSDVALSCFFPRTKGLLVDDSEGLMIRSEYVIITMIIILLIKQTSFSQYENLGKLPSFNFVFFFFEFY